MNEIWKTVPGFDSYEVSSDGNVRRIKPGPRTRVGRHKVKQVTREGYFAVTLFRNDGKAHRRNVHTLLCLAFHGPPPKGYDQVRHIDGSKTNNTPSNLKWCNAKINAEDRKVHGTQTRGGEHPSSILDESDVIEIKVALRNKVNQIAIAKRFNVCPSTICCIKRGATWGHVRIQNCTESNARTEITQNKKQ